MPSIAVAFELDCASTNMGQLIFVVGCHPGMGSWKPTGSEYRNRQLSTSELTYPRWIMANAMWLELPEGAQELEIWYKYVRMAPPRSPEWEAGPDRRIVLRAVPRGNDVWIVRDHQWGATRDAATVFACSHDELISSRCKVDQNWRPAATKAAKAAPVIPKLPMAKVNPPDSSKVYLPGGDTSEDNASSEEESIADVEKSPEKSDEDARSRQRVASAILKQLEVAADANRPGCLDTEAQLAALRRENAALRAVLRCLAAGEVKVATCDRRKQRQVIMRTASLVPEEVWAFAFDSPEASPAPRNRRMSYGAEVLKHRQDELCASAQTTLEGLFWDWPLSRSERKQRLLLAESRLQALEGQELLQEIVQENAAERQELSEVTQVLKEQIAKLRGKGLATWGSASRSLEATRGGG